MDNNHTKEFLLVAAVGSIIGCAAIILMSPNCGKKIYQKINDTYSHLMENTKPMAKQAKAIVNEASDWVERAKETINEIKKCGGICEEYSAPEPICTKMMLSGALAGGVLGATIALLMAPKTGQELRQDLSDVYQNISDKTQNLSSDIAEQGKDFAHKTSSKANQWLKIAQELVSELTDESSRQKDELTERTKKAMNSGVSHLNNMVEWASIGLRMWKHLNAKN